MTTIVFRDRVMACDSQHTYDDTKFYGVKKIESGANSLIGIAGASRFANCVFDWWRAVEMDESLLVPDWHRTGQLLAEDVVMLLAHRAQGLFRLDCTGRASKIHANYAALGTGAGFALGAMAMKATATQAIDIAMMYDLYTGGEIAHVSY